SLPMALDKRLLNELRRLDDPDLRRTLIFVRGLLRARGDDLGAPPGEEFAAEETGPVTYRLEAVRCGKPGCTKCPHGPYWYAYYREKGKLRSRYIGPNLPAGESKA
ncbi:MAG: hypothetical protein M3271_05660, partial [Actinomycetota bacterium]|nr:hypothetical protein [Actinomycetota bacterium]